MTKRKSEMTYRSVDDLFEQLLGSIQEPSDYVKQIYPNFRLRVGVVKCRSPRHAFFEEIRDMGMMFIHGILNHTAINCGSTLTLVFPERWLSVQEQGAFMSLLCDHPAVLAGKIKRVDILTSSPLMISDFFSEQLVIMSFDDDVQDPRTRVKNDENNHTGIASGLHREAGR